MILEKLSTKPSNKTLKRLLLLSIIIFVIVYPIMGISFMLSGFPVDFTTSQLSFSGAKLKVWYAQTADLNLYTLAQCFDYGFMVSYGLLAFSLALLIGRKYEEGSKWRMSGIIIAIIGILAAILDASENACILITLTNPGSFPDIIAIIHSVFALIKYLCLIIAITWALIAGVYYLVKKRT
ncbi:MAG: hypothetical protein EU541_04490 [Promethearchaeota archaeon]|nr:MAG: hypothetical protein EU541_04490 [Candidatus Lokiarchaeota archaeon]